MLSAERLRRQLKLELEIKIMNIDEFKHSYVTNVKREKIYSEFEEYLNIVKEYLSPYVLLVYGSFITEKDFPSDIDVLLHGFVKNEKVATFDIGIIRSNGLVHIKSEVSALKQEIIIKSSEELIEGFQKSENNKAKGIKIGEYVQIDF